MQVEDAAVAASTAARVSNDAVIAVAFRSGARERLRTIRHLHSHAVQPAQWNARWGGTRRRRRAGLAEGALC